VVSNADRLYQGGYIASLAKSCGIRILA
jgi:hypothetical protein